MNTWTTDEEAERLAARFAGKNRAKFARDFGVPGGQVMIYQHITGRRPISLDAAEAYAKGFGCPLEEISPRLAQEAKKAFAMLGEQPGPGAEDAEISLDEVVLSADEIDLITMYRDLGDETKRLILVQLKTFSGQTSKKVNNVNPENSATMPDASDKPLALEGSSEKHDEAHERRRRIFRFSSASQSTKDERKGGQSR
jgi:hypothetical protein